MDVITWKVLFICLFIMIIHTIETLAYGTRLSGARVRMIASALSLFSIMVIFSRTSNMIHQPFTGSLIDNATGISVVEQQFRIIIGAASIGTIIGAILLPTFISIFSRAVIHLKDERGSIPNLIKNRLSISYLKRLIVHIQLPKISVFKELNYRVLPLKFFMIHVAITAIFTIGVLSALYASLLAPDRATTAIMASGLINGIATILLVIFVDPKIAILADEVGNKQGNYINLRDTTGMLVLSRFVGTIFAQILFIPGAYYVAWFTKYIN